MTTVLNSGAAAVAEEVEPIDLVGLVEDLHQQLLSATSTVPIDRPTLMGLLRDAHPLLGRSVADSAVDELLHRMTGLGPLEPLLADLDITEVMVNGPGPVWVEKAGVLDRTSIVVSTAEIERVVERIVAPLGLRVDRASPMVDARLPDGSRVHVVVPPLAVDGPCITIRRFGVQAVPLSAFGPASITSVLEAAVAGRRNILVSGGTGAGKTTLLNALAALLPADTRLVTIEDTAELRLGQPHVIRLESRVANADGVGAVPLSELLRNALRMRPDRIIVGEVRGPEALDMVQAMNTGHEGSLSTCHANSPADAIRRLETMVMVAASGLPLAAVRDQIVASIDVVVQVARVGGERRVVQVAEPVLGDGGIEARVVATDRGVITDFVRPDRLTP